MGCEGCEAERALACQGSNNFDEASRHFHQRRCGMPEELFSRHEIDRFIRDEIETVPQLEALLLFWRHSPSEWTCEGLARQLYVPPAVADSILKYLSQRGFIVETGGAAVPAFRLRIGSAQNERMLASLDHMYRQELVRVSKMIHANASPALKGFARSFRFKKD